MRRRWTVVGGAAVTAVLVGFTGVPNDRSSGPAFVPVGPDQYASGVPVELRMLTEPEMDASALFDESRRPPDLDALALPVVPDELHDLASAVTVAFDGWDEFASVEFPSDRQSLIIHWYGTPSPELEVLIGASHGIEVELRQTSFMPGELRAAAADLVRTVPGVVLAGANHDGSGIFVHFNEDADGARRVRAANTALEEALAALPFPVDVRRQEGWVAIPATHQANGERPPSTRQFDWGLRLGGARINRWSWLAERFTGRCSSAFAITQADGRPGMLSAAHCGEIGQTALWAVIDGNDAVGWGSFVHRVPRHDAAVITTAFATPGVWIGPWTGIGSNAPVPVPINSVGVPIVGQELCMSGSFSGLVCGNIVVSSGVVFTLTGTDVVNAHGAVTQQIEGVPAAGNGDSGGPAYGISTGANGVRRHAVGIIAGIPGNSPHICTGYPGSSTAGGRRCSTQVIITSVAAAVSELGARVQVHP